MLEEAQRTHHCTARTTEENSCAAMVVGRSYIWETDDLPVTYLTPISVSVAVSPLHKRTEKQKPLPGLVTSDDLPTVFLELPLPTLLNHSLFLHSANPELRNLFPQSLQQAKREYFIIPLIYQQQMSVFLCINNNLPPNYFHRKYKQHFFSPGTSKLKKDLQVIP